MNRLHAAGAAPAAIASPVESAPRLALAALLLAYGAAMATWVVRIPYVRERLELDASSLGLALLAAPLGALVAMPPAGRLVARHGSDVGVRAAAIALSATLPLPVLAPRLPWLVVALLIVGAANGALNVAVNAQAAALEQRLERPILSSLHGCYSLGGMAGALVGGAVTAAGASAVPHLVAAAISFGVVALVCSRALPQALAGATPAPAAAAAFALPERRLLALGAVAFCALLGEGAMADWSAVYLRGMSGRGPGLAAAGFAAFSLAMATGRILGDGVIARVGRPNALGFAGVVATAGLAVALASREPLVVIGGFGLVGAGLSTAFPNVLGLACRVGRGPAGVSIAAVSTMGFAGLLTGPLVIGSIARTFDLRVGLSAVIGGTITIVVLSRRVRS